MKLDRRWLLGLVFVALALAGWAVLRGSWRTQPPASAPKAPASAGPEAIAYPAGAPQLGMIRSEAMAAVPVPVADALAARLAYDEDATARVFAPVAGRIVTLGAQAGDHVTAGQVLARIDAPDFGTAQADLEKARADEARKRLAFERARELGPGEGIAMKDLEAARADHDAARAETARAAQRVRNVNPLALRVDGQRVALTSPLTGVVSERNANPSLEVAPGGPAPLFVVTDPRRLWLMIDLPEKLLPVIRPGAHVSVESDAYPGEVFDARVLRVGQVVDPNTRRVVARALVDNRQGKLLPEMFVRAVVLQDAGQAVRVPNSAIVTRGIYSYVFVETAPGTFARRRVELAVRGADSSYVARGLAGGEQVVTGGALLLDAEIAAVDKP
jgi:membrane fusion protein, heavy metal efflux system